MRIPIVMGATPGPQDAVLVEDGADMPPAGYAVRFALPAGQPGHAAGCACCTLRGPAADALTTLYRARATATAPYFTRVILLGSPAAAAAIRAAIEDDVVTKARFRLG